MMPWYLSLDDRPWEAYVNQRYPVICLDFETTNLDNGDPRNPANRIVMTALNLDGGRVMCGTEAESILSHCSGQPAILVAHNAKFELGWLAREGIDTSQWLVWDTMIAEYVLAGNRRWDLDLDSVAGRYGLGHKGRLIATLMQNGVCPSEMPEHMLRERVLWDVEKTYKLFRLQTQVLAELDLIRVLFTRCLLTPVLADMETVGLRLNAKKVTEEYDRLLQRRAEIEAEIKTLAGGKKLKGPQLAEVLYDDLGFKEPSRNGQPLRTESGRRKTDAATLEGLRAETAKQRRFVALRSEYGKVDAALTKNVEFFYWICQERGGEFVANFNQCRTGTHRLSSSGKPVTFSNGKRRSVQFQNLPRAYKGLFEAPEGYLYDESDGMQLEWRCGGSLSRDPQVLEDVLTGHDVHRFTSSQLLRLDMESVTKSQRQAAKPKTFKPMYGGQRGTKREMEYFAAFRERYKVMSQAQTAWAHEVLKTGRLKTATGLIFYWPDTRMTNDGYITNSTNIFDYPIQNLATAEIIPIGVVYLYWTLKDREIDAKLVNTVHDSVLGMVAEKELDKYRECVVYCFLDRTYEYLNKVYGLDLYVPLGVESKADRFWGGGDEVKVSYAMGGKQD